MTPAAPPRDVFCVVPARGGSRRIVGKNLQEVGGIPLVARSVRTALEAFGRVFVSTDDEGIAQVARNAGATVPELRPAALATDTATMDVVVHHAVERWAESSDDVVVVTQPTSPFTTSGDLTDCVAALRAQPHAATSVLATAVPAAHGFALRADADGLSVPLEPQLFDARSQDLPALWLPTGGAFCVPADRVRAGGRLLESPFAVVEIPVERAIDIDEPDDLDRARAEAAR